jgi:hypothetical protein
VLDELGHAALGHPRRNAGRAPGESAIAFEELLARFPGIEARGAAACRPSLATAVVERLPVAFG